MSVLILNRIPIEFHATCTVKLFCLQPSNPNDSVNLNLMEIYLMSIINFVSIVTLCLRVHVVHCTYFPMGKHRSQLLSHE